jgi:hemerythrin-like domain-containing protein
MAFQIGQRPDHDFDEPLGLLSDCHRRIEHFLRVLIAVDAEAAGGTLTMTHRAGLEGALRYFAVAAPRHTADEEQSLFPRLRDAGDPTVTQALELVERLEHDHDEAEEHHAAVDTLVRRWLENDRLVPNDSAELRERQVRLQSLYQRHISLEDEQLFPAAARVLDAKQIEAIGREMAARRHVLSHPILVEGSTGRRRTE